MTGEFERIPASRHQSDVDAREAASMFAAASPDGVYSHGINRFSHIVDSIDQGLIKVRATLAASATIPKPQDPGRSIPLRSVFRKI
jgi:LDH2 family malate/lactate/ureidoglycolate dehydrogenase